MRGTGRTTLLVYTVLGYSSGFRCGPVSDVESSRASHDGAPAWTTRMRSAVSSTARSGPRWLRECGCAGDGRPAPFPKDHRFDSNRFDELSRQAGTRAKYSSEADSAAQFGRVRALRLEHQLAGSELHWQHVAAASSESCDQFPHRARPRRLSDSHWQSTGPGP
jgi:hypothetical protein